MQKIILIIRREFLTRVRKRTFIIGTILFPLLYLGLIFGTGYIANKTRETLKVGLIDESKLFTEKYITAVNGNDSNRVELITDDPESFKSNFDSKGYDGYIIIPKNFKWQTGIDTNRILVNTKKSFGFGALNPIQQKINDIWNKIKRDSLGLDSVKETILSQKIDLKVSNEKDKNANDRVATVIGYVSGFLMYFILALKRYKP